MNSFLPITSNVHSRGAQIPQRRRSAEHAQCKAKRGYLRSTWPIHKANHGFIRTLHTYVWFALLSLLQFQKKKKASFSCCRIRLKHGPDRTTGPHTSSYMTDHGPKNSYNLLYYGSVRSGPATRSVNIINEKTCSSFVVYVRVRRQ